MIRLIYFSTARLGLARQDLEIILNQAIASNIADGITGILMFNGRNFMQILEGPRQAVQDLFARIMNDSRHTGVVLIKTDELAAFSYPVWGMKLKELDSDFDGSFLRLHQEVADALVELSDTSVKAIIKTFLLLD